MLWRQHLAVHRRLISMHDASARKHVNAYTGRRISLRGESSARGEYVRWKRQASVPAVRQFLSERIGTGHQRLVGEVEQPGLLQAGFIGYELNHQQDHEPFPGIDMVLRSVRSAPAIRT